MNSAFLSPPDDLSALSIIIPDALKAYVAAVNASPDTGKKRVLVISTGGTIGMVTDENGIRIPHFDVDAVFSHLNPNLIKKFQPLGFDALQIDSSQMTYAHVRDLAIAFTYIWNNLKVPVIGFLVLHGTDTMSYAAAAFSLITGAGLPFSVIYTGSQKPISEPLSDAPPNIRNSLYLLESLHDSDMAEVIIAMGDYAVLGTSAEKVDEKKATAFDAPRHKYIAYFNRLEYPVPLASWLKPRRRVPFAPTIWLDGNYGHTLVVKSTLGLNPAVVARQMRDPDIKAAIIYSFGAGTMDEKIVEAVMNAAAERTMPVFLVNPTDAAYAVTYLSNFIAVEKGAVPLDMTLSAALAKIEIALRIYGSDVKALANFMTTNYVGEIPDAVTAFVPTK